MECSRQMAERKTRLGKTGEEREKEEVRKWEWKGREERMK